MAEAVTAGAAALLPGLPDEIVVWEILVRLLPNSLLRCRAVCRAWRHTTSSRGFLLAHHGRQPSLPVVCEYERSIGYKSILSFDHRAAAGAQLRPVALIDNDNFFCQKQASCDGLLILSANTKTWRTCLAVCNPATRQRGFLRQPRDASSFRLWEMYLHGPSGEYRLLLYLIVSRALIVGEDQLPERRIGCYVSTLGSDQPPRYIGQPEGALSLGSQAPVLVRDCLHWSPVHHQGNRKLMVVFDTAAESFRQMCAPVTHTNSSIFEMDGMLAVYNYDDAMKAVNIWVLPDYQGEVWEYKYRVELPVAEMSRRFGRKEGLWDVTLVSTDGIVLLLLTHKQWLFYVDIHGGLVHSFHRDVQNLFAGIRLKQTLVPHAFFAALEDYAVNASPFI